MDILTCRLTDPHLQRAESAAEQNVGSGALRLLAHAGAAFSQVRGKMSAVRVAADAVSVVHDRFLH